MIGEAEFDLLTNLVHVKFNFLAAEKEAGAVLPGMLPTAETPRLLLQKPRLASFQETESLRLRAAAGDDETGHAIGAQTEQVTAGAGLANEKNAEAMLPRAGLIRAGWAHGRGLKALDLSRQKAEAELDHRRCNYVAILGEVKRR